ncbi:hypothetical protein [Synechococcus sp. HK01-R]|uniref:hypothetical protein n=1 Tax=Synechococcus sp. HK01-R TaxID=2751171 RepID=UPI00162968AE|nr:hypothetical protein [Synechococcus sp. HK01-R]QNG26438.1 hypothetical protein H0O21_09200 [Synechococcus sp. HK01-R]
MANVFRDPVPYTLRSVRYRVDPEWLSLTLRISEDGTLGQTPADYLEPVFRVGASTRGTALTTRFSRRLQRGGVFTPGTHLVPITGARHAETRRGRMSQTVYQAALGQLRANEFAVGKQRSRGRYFAIDRSSSSSTLQPGIYREKNGSISRLFALLDSPPSVPRLYDWRDASIDEAIDQLEGRIARILAR